MRKATVRVRDVSRVRSYHGIAVELLGPCVVNPPFPTVRAWVQVRKTGARLIVRLSELTTFRRRARV